MDAAICTEGDYSADFVKNPAALGQFRETTSVNNFAGNLACYLGSSESMTE